MHEIEFNLKKENENQRDGRSEREEELNEWNKQTVYVPTKVNEIQYMYVCVFVPHSYLDEWIRLALPFIL